MKLKTFLSNLANAFRTVLGTTETINAQGFVDKVNEVFEAGKAQGGGDVTKNPMYYMSVKDFQWQGAVFPEGFDFVLNVFNKPKDMNAMLMRTTGIKTVTLICEAEGTVNMAQLLRESTAEVLDITGFKPIPTSIAYLVYLNESIVSILGEIDMSSCTAATSSFAHATALKDIRFKECTISIALSFANCSLLTAESRHSIIKGYSKEATATLTLPANTQSVYDAVYGEGAWDNITAEYPNLTIVYG